MCRGMSPGTPYAVGDYCCPTAGLRAASPPAGSGELMKAQAETVGKAKGGRPSKEIRGNHSPGLSTLDEAGI